MTTPFLSKLRSALRILLSVSILLAGICLMAACLGICHSGGDQPFSRESVAAAFRPIALPCWICIGLIAVSSLLEFLLPVSAPRGKAPRQTAMVLKRLQEKTDLSLCGGDLRSAVLALRIQRRRLQYAGWALLAVCSLVFFSYGANPHNFHRSRINASMIDAMYRFVPCFLIPYCYGIWAAYAARRSMEKEIALLKTAPPESKISRPVKAGGRNLLLLRNGLLVIGIAILLFGYFTGGTADVLTKAVNICTECVGLG